MLVGNRDRLGNIVHYLKAEVLDLTCLRPLGILEALA